jgi:hypothetical protein
MLNEYVVVVAVGVATGFAHVLQLKVPDGDHWKVPLPVPLKVALAPGHIVWSPPAFAEGKAG